MRTLWRWWNRLVPTRKALIMLAVSGIAILIVVLIVGYPWLRDRCGPGVKRLGPNHECVGVTDGRYPFHGLEGVLVKIREENRRVERQSVSIAYALPLDDANIDLAEGLRHELEGAYLAQQQANRTQALAGNVPLIRLLVANTGKQNEQWGPVIEQLLHETGPPDPLVAVLGFGESRETTRQAIGKLTDQRIPVPVIAVRLTADNLGSRPGLDRVEGLVRVAPTNSDEATAASAFLKSAASQPTFGRALLIQDDNKADLYAQTLGSAFTTNFPDGPTHTLVSPVERYDSSLEGVPNTFARMMPNICQQHPDVVYFAGRSDELRDFLEVLPRRTCKDTHITIVTGDAASAMSGAVQRQLANGNRELQVALEANTTLWYTGLAHPDAWEAAPGSFNLGATNPFRLSCAGCFKNLFPAESLVDGAAIMGYDAVVTVVTAIRLTVTQQDPSIRRGAIIQQWKQTHNCNAVAGASGWISLDDRGNPNDKAIPILELTPEGGVKFVKLTSPLGEPFIPHC